MSQDSDSEVLRLSLTEPAAFATIVDRYQAPFLRKAVQILRSGEEAEDAVQDTFVKIYAHAPRFAEQAGAAPDASVGVNFRAWAYKILLNTCFSRYRKLRRERVRFQWLGQEESERLAGGVEGDYEGRLACLVSLVATLPTTLRRVASLHWLRGWTTGEVAAAEGLRPGAVRTRLSRARRLLQEKMDTLC